MLQPKETESQFHFIFITVAQQIFGKDAGSVPLYNG